MSLPKSFDCLAGRVSIAKDGMVAFRYTIPGGDTCKFHLLSECGEVWRRGFERALNIRAIELEAREAPPPIHYANFVVMS